MTSGGRAADWKTGSFGPYGCPENLSVRFFPNSASSPFTTGAEHYSRTATVPLPYPSSDTRDIIAAAQAGLRAIYIPGPAYAKAGVILMEFVGAGEHTADLFAPAPRPNSERLMAVVDAINRREGRNTIRTARTVGEKTWSMKRDRLSQRFTTSWSELLTVS
ncbi:DUF4113 domain-containing protein (plasmid) [Pseudomonas aeruginosa]|uniref:DUF4113 domain-containing protein n=1 Tax=Pseudomonas aeruginosa TaxID=287 RepID=UPI0022DD0194|nr:DUF4113 domain-containing protein [Pseudomonas aeruginosa]WBM11025.1 DUF4113 domain-containing protein [Pseudomonas aeruginosa]